MKNNVCEDMNNPSELDTFHEKLLSEMNLPKWMDLDCPYCKKHLPLKAIRSFGVKLNTRNVGDLTVEVLCDSCDIMDTLYFRNEIGRMSDVVEFIQGDRSPKSDGILEKDMFDLKSNNAVEEMLKRRRQDVND